MAESSLIKKLGIKLGQRIVVLNAPESYPELLHPLPVGTTLSTTASEGQHYDVVQLFVTSVANLNTQAETALAALKPGGLLWLAYPKKTSKIKTDINRDSGWDALGRAGFLGVSMISIDDTWSSLRFRPREEIKSLARKQQ